MDEIGRVVGNTDARGRPRVQTVNNDPSLTVQSDAHLADIQTILEGYGATGHQSLDEAAMIYKDVSEFVDLRDAIEQSRIAEKQFMTLPSKVREIFDHDVAVWLDSAHDEDKRDALVEAGFLDPREVEQKPKPKAKRAPNTTADPLPETEGDVEDPEASE